MNTIDLAGRNAVITGGARGIGYAIAERFIGSGASVALWDVDADGLAGAAKTLGAAATAIVNVADPDSVAAATEATLGALGKIDILVNNAGIAGDNAT